MVLQTVTAITAMRATADIRAIRGAIRIIRTTATIPAIRAIQAATTPVGQAATDRLVAEVSEADTVAVEAAEVVEAAGKSYKTDQNEEKYIFDRSFNGIAIYG